MTPLTRASAERIVTWQYPPPYDIYSLADSNPAQLRAALAYLTDPANHFYQMTTAVNELTAFCSFGKDGQVPGGDYRQPALDIGLGVHPDLTGRGWGHLFAATAVAAARRTFQPPALRVTIAAFNQRAQKVWAKIGFTPTAACNSLRDERPYIIMTRDIAADMLQ